MTPPGQPLSRDTAVFFASAYECPACGAKAEVGETVHVQHDPDCRIAALLQREKGAA